MQSVYAYKKKSNDTVPENVFPSDEAFENSTSARRKSELFYFIFRNVPNFQQSISRKRDGCAYEHHQENQF